MKNRDVNNNHQNKYGKLKTILSIFSFKLNRFPNGRLMKQRSTLCDNVLIKQWGVNCWEIYDPFGKMDDCDISIIYSNYKPTSNQIYLLYTCRSPR